MNWTMVVFGNGVDAAKCSEEVESGSILDFELDIQWDVYDLSKKVEMALKKHEKHNFFFQFYRLKLKEIVFVISKFQQSDLKNYSNSESFRRNISFEEYSFTNQGKEMEKRFLDQVMWVCMV
ncbi:unnamed protein product [Lactuca virosa]|uniref:Uncharacterized protein n=1 Tax=Lactuca virosa TaxID=75947 RepID=A0AAU9NIQ6_9ASTR|nr:unnamed protein product [Lactuca virosa]